MLSSTLLVFLFGIHQSTLALRLAAPSSSGKEFIEDAQIDGMEPFEMLFYDPEWPEAGIDKDGRLRNWKGKAFSDPEVMNDDGFLKYIGYRGREHGFNKMNGLATGAIKKDFEEYLHACYENNKDEIEIGEWMGRLGNNLWQVHNSIIIAIKSGRKYVRMPKHPLIEFPEDGIPIDPNDSLGRDCEFTLDKENYDCRLSFFQRCASTVNERKAVYQKYILPHFKKVLSACERESEDVLTIHMRSGDVAMDKTGCHAQPPCSYFTAVLNEGNGGRAFHTAKVIANGDPRNPCIDEIKKSNADKTILISEGGSEAHDYCSLLVASNLAVTVSSFSTTAKMLNTKINRLFYPDLNEAKLNEVGCGGGNAKLHEMGFDFNGKEVCKAFPAAVRYDFETGLLTCSLFDKMR